MMRVSHGQGRGTPSAVARAYLLLHTGEVQRQQGRDLVDGVQPVVLDACDRVLQQAQMFCRTTSHEDMSVAPWALSHTHRR